MAEFDKQWEWRAVAVPRSETPKKATWKLALELLVPFVIAALLWAWGKILWAEIVAGIGALLIALRFGAPSLFDLVLRGLTVLGHWIGKVVSKATLTIVYILVFAPTALIGRLLKLDTLGLRRQSFNHSYWVDVPQVNRNRFFKRPFLVETPSTGSNRKSVKWFRIARFTYNATLSLILLNFLTAYVYNFRIWSPNDELSRRSQLQLAVLQNDAWAEGYFREFSETSKEYQPYVVWARSDYQGRYINIENHVRKSYQTVKKSQKDLSLYMFGGSTTWGVGARDEFTIPSHLAKIAEQDGIPLQVTNFGESGYVNWQNVIRLAEICADGEIPDFVVFYIGANDMFAKILSPDLSRPHLNLADVERLFDPDSRSRAASEWIKDNSAVHKIARKIGKWIKGKSEAEKMLQGTIAARSQTVGEMAQDLVSMLQANASFVRRLEAVCGFESWYFWQPLTFTKTTLSAEERSHPGIGFDDLPRDLYRAATREIQGQRFAIDVSDAFDSQDQTIYIDWAHVTELGNEIVSRRIYDQIKPAITAKLAASRSRTPANEHSGN